MQPIIDSLPNDWQIVIWDNGERMVTRSDGFAEVCHDLSVFGRYAAIEYATNDVIYVADDDVIVSEPQVIVDALVGAFRCRWCGYCEGNRQTWCNCGCGRDYNEMIPMRDEAVVCNQPQEFRHDFYSEHSLVGFGAAFHRDAPGKAFHRFAEWMDANRQDELMRDQINHFNRCCDIVFTGLTPCVRVDVPKENLPHAYADDRMWRQPTHQAERQRMLALVRRVRDER